MPERLHRLVIGLTTCAFVAVALRLTADAAAFEYGKPGIVPAPCPQQAWQEADPTFTALPGAKASFGRYPGGTYRIEVPEKWNGDLVLWSHGYAANNGPRGSQLRVDVPAGTTNGSPFREHLIKEGFAWAASSYRCNGYVPGQGLLDTMALTEIVTRESGRAPSRVYLTGGSMGGHITLLGMQEFPTAFAGGLALCPSGPGEMDYLQSVAAASEFITGVKVTSATRADDVAKLTAILGKPPEYTEKGRQLASVQVYLSGGPRPFALEGLAARFVDNASTVADSEDRAIWNRISSTSDVRYALDERLGLSAAALNTGVRRKAADETARGPQGPHEEAIPFDGKISRPVMTLHTTGDLYVPISLERILKRAVDGAGQSSQLVQRMVRSAGHCTFTADEIIDGFDDLVTWSRSGVRPPGDDVMGDLSDAGLTFTKPRRPSDPGTLTVAPAPADTPRRP